MNSTIISLLGLELIAFPVQDHQAIDVSPSAEVYEQGNLSVPALQRPAIQPYFGVQKGALTLSVAPAFSLHKGESTSGSELNSVGWRIEGRAWWLSSSWLVGSGVSVAGARLTMDQALVAEAPSQVSIEPTIGRSVDLEERLQLIGRLRSPILIEEGALQLGLGGAIALEFRK